MTPPPQRLRTRYLTGGTLFEVRLPPHLKLITAECNTGPTWLCDAGLGSPRPSLGSLFSTCKRGSRAVHAAGPGRTKCSCR